MGVGLAAAQAGDKIAILVRSEEPFVIRSNELSDTEGSFTLIRRAYLRADSAQLELLMSGSLTFRLEPYPAPAAARQLAAPLSLSLSLARSSRYASARVCASAAASTAPSPRPDADAELEVEPEQQQPPLYRISRAVKTVDRLWREWTVGLGGGPSIRMLDAR
ncbi:hypothetical protein K432DRAFT_410118 [Lepidopterella palustris CBS 459.81]|uniref:Transcription activator GCR1-like domain-containing protein n=1 Tax=Lepidopterella palustris CBS 459.81 TaxID=1314670 RepID=A0A8E2DYW2_9PEZI|nr:hypothetical protein K432DRAFT_410118 [Lepidopterella palustris CBS 459.81]